MVDLFAGGGGASVGIEAALGRPVDIAINHSATALAVHAANHPQTRHLTADIWEVKPLEATGGAPVDVLWASPDCFPAGIRILTFKGYRPIETVKVGDLVLTHEGRWRPVTTTMRTRKRLLQIYVQGGVILRVSPEHPFMAKTFRDDSTVTEDGWTWVPAKDLQNKLVAGHHAAFSPSEGFGPDWLFVTDVIDVGEEEHAVFNLSVEEDESYIAEGLIVHNCTHFSVAKGDVPRSQNIRSLAWAVCRWVKATAPEWVFLENVREFRGWGPLDESGRPDKKRMGETFKRFQKRLENCGYRVEFRVLDAALYGAPTRRHRLFMVARKNNGPIFWPTPTHGAKVPLRTAAECIDWSIPCPSIFERKKPLAEKTLWRIAQGLDRFVFKNPKPFIVKFRHDSHGSEIGEPMPTITAGGKERPSRPATGNPLGIVMPSLVEMNHSNAPHGVDEPLGVVTSQHNRFNLVAPTLVKVNHGGAGDRSDRSEDIGAPLSTITATQRGHAVVVPTMVTIDNASSANGFTSVETPLPTTTTENRHAVIAPTLVQTGYGEREGQAPRALNIEEPLGTVVAGGSKLALIEAFLARHFTGVVGAPLELPLPTVTAVDHHSLVTATMVEPGQRNGGGQRDANEPLGTIVAKDRHALAAATLLRFNHDDHGIDPNLPLPTVTADSNHIAEVRAFLTVFYGQDRTGGQSLFEPTRTITAKHRLGLVTVNGTEYQIVDIGLRMLSPAELLRAQFGRFAADYDMSAAKTQAAKVRLIGNSVAPEVAEALVRANVPVEMEAVA